MQLNYITLTSIFLVSLMLSSIEAEKAWRIKGNTKLRRLRKREGQRLKKVSQKRQSQRIGSGLSSLPVGAKRGATTAPLIQPMISTGPSLGQTGVVVVSAKAQEFKAAIQGHNFNDAWTIYHGADDETRRQCGGHLRSLGYAKVVQMINGIGDRTNKSQMLGIVLAHAGQGLFDRILDKFGPDEDLLKSSASSNVDLACNPDGFMAVLNRITKKSEQVEVIRSDVYPFFEKNKTECLDPLISALQGKASPDPSLVNVAVQEAFEKACEYTDADHRSSFAKHFYDHHAISAKNYSNALYCAYKNADPDYELVKWVILKADRDDLNAFMADERFSHQPSKLQVDMRKCSQSPFLPKDRQKKASEKWGKGIGMEMHQRLVEAKFKTTSPKFIDLLQDAWKKKKGDIDTGNTTCKYPYWEHYSSVDAAGNMFQEMTGMTLIPGKKFDTREVACDIAYFHRLIDFEEAMTCYDITNTGSRSYTPSVLSGMLGDVLLGYVQRDDLVDKADERTTKWTEEMLKLQSGLSFVAAGHMLHAALNLWKSQSHPTPLLQRFTSAMITIRLSDLLYRTSNPYKAKHLYKYLIDHNISEKHFFSGGIGGHDLIVSFQPSSGTNQANVTYINSGHGIAKHPSKLFSTKEYGEATPTVADAEKLERYIPFATYANRPNEMFIEDSGYAANIDKLYFNAPPDNIDLTYEDWQYVDDQRAGTCYAMMLWYLPYWLEQDDQFQVEVLILELKRELLHSALKDLQNTVDLTSEFVGNVKSLPGRITDEEVREYLHWAIKMKKTFISFGLNEALQTMKGLCLKFDMTAVMNGYKRLWDEYQWKDYVWRMIRPNVKDMYESAHNLILKDITPIPGRALASLSEEELHALVEVKRAIDDNAPTRFVQAAKVLLSMEARTRPSIQVEIMRGIKGLNLEGRDRKSIVKALLGTTEGGKAFIKAMKKDDLGTAKNIMDISNEKLKEQLGVYLVSFGSDKLIDMISNHATNRLIKLWLLGVILIYANQEFIDEVLREVRPNNSLLKGVASNNADLACTPERFILLLEKITKRHSRITAVKLGVDALVKMDKVKCIDPLLSKLKSKGSWSPDLMNVAILSAFSLACNHADDRSLLAKTYFNHPAISARDYSNALFISYNSDPKHELFFWLLTRADPDDLKEITEDWRFSGMNEEFRDKVQHALHSVSSKPGVRRRK